MHPVIEWRNNRVYMLDQRLLPMEETYIEHSDFKQVAESIRTMAIRGAPAIGVAAAMGIALGVVNLQNNEDLASRFNEIVTTITQTRPTAVNLFWAAERMKKVFYRHQNDLAVLKEKMVSEALAIDQEDVKTNRRIGKNGQKLLKSGDTVLTHCNAGELATAGYGTALGVIRSAIERGKAISVIAGETRPFLQGARLTVWELQRDNIPVTLITDNMAGAVMKKGLVQAVMVGADRIARNGDTANKIGTYTLAVLARHHRIPFYVAAPLSTIDFSINSGKKIPIEERDKSEVLSIRSQEIARPHTCVFNPAFDVTPARLISAIITEAKVLRQPFKKSIQSLKK